MIVCNLEYYKNKSEQDERHLTDIWTDFVNLKARVKSAIANLIPSVTNTVACIELEVSLCIIVSL